MELRRATGGDAEAALEAWRAARAGAGQRPSAARVARVADKLAAPDALLVVAVQDDDVVGFALGEWGRGDDGAGELEPGLLHLALLCVHPSAQRSGLGSALAEELADTAYPKGARRLSAWVPEADRIATAFFEAVGLEATGRTQSAGLVQYEGELEAPLRELRVRKQGLRLGQLLKLAGLVETGSDGKALLEAGEVLVNGEVEQRRGRQLVDADVVEARGSAVRVLLPTDAVPSDGQPA